MPDDDKEIRDLIHRWAAAVHVGDLDDVLAQHGHDIVMFDIPLTPIPPLQVRPFARYQKKGGRRQVKRSPDHPR